MMNTNKLLFRPLCSVVTRFHQRGFASLSFETFGAPSVVLRHDASNFLSSAPLQEGVCIKMQASPIMLEDERRIRGQSLVNNNVGLGGTVGVGIVSSVGSNVTHLRASDMVLVATPCWADEVTIPVNRVVKLPNLSIEEVSSIPFFLYGEGILRSLPGLKKGDTIFQLSGAGVINDAVVQLAKVRGIQVVSVSESDLLEIKKLKALGNAHHAIAGVANKKVVHQLTKTLLPNGAVVIHHGVYQPISSMTSIDLPVSATIFKNISIRGFDLASWMKYDMASLTSVTASIVELVQTKKISLSTTHQHEMLDYKKAFEDAKNNTAALSVLRLS